MEIWILVAIVAMHLIDRLFTAWSARERESDAKDRVAKATSALAEAWAANAKMQEQISVRDAVILAHLNKPVTIPRRAKAPVPQAAPQEYQGNGRIPR